jgi:hypothetical protein
MRATWQCEQNRPEIAVCNVVCRSVALLALALAACSVNSTASKEPAQACVPGEQRACPCPGGAQGVQTCDDTGARLGDCLGCDGAGGAGGGSGGSAGAGGGGAGAGGGGSSVAATAVLLGQANNKYNTGLHGFQPINLTAAIDAGAMLLVGNDPAITGITGVSDSKQNTWTLEPMSGVIRYVSIVANPLGAGDKISFGGNGDGILVVTEVPGRWVLSTTAFQNGAAASAPCTAGGFALVTATIGEDAALAPLPNGWTRANSWVGYDWVSRRGLSIDYMSCNANGRATYPAVSVGAAWNYVSMFVLSPG